MKQFTPSVVAPLETWDNTTDAIVWLIEQTPAFHVECAELALESLPEQYHASRRFVTPENMSADLEGWIKNKGKVHYLFSVDYTEVTDPEADDKVEGYIVTVDVRYLGEFGSKAKRFAVYSIAGCDRSDFRLVSEKVEAQA